MLKRLLDLTAELLFAQIVDEDLHPLLVDIVAPCVEVPHAQDRLDIGEYLRRGAEIADLVRDEGGAPHAAAGIDLEAFLARFRSEEHTSELQSLMRISYAVFCLKKNIIQITTQSRA